MTRAQLGYAGYEIAKSSLPVPVGCYRSEGRIILLYDPAHATKKSVPQRDRATKTVTEIFWPLTLRLFLDEYVNTNPYTDARFRIEEDVEAIAYHLSAFSAAEVKHMAGEYLHLKIAPCLVHRSYVAFQTAFPTRSILMKSIAAAYQQYKAAS